MPEPERFGNSPQRLAVPARSWPRGIICGVQGRRRGDRQDGAPGGGLACTGSRSPPTPTTSSAMPASPAPWRLSGWRSGEVAANGVIVKQLLQAEAIEVCQVDAGRVGDVNEVVSILLMAAKFGVPVRPHAAVSGCARTCSTWRSSTTSGWAGCWTVGWSSMLDHLASSTGCAS